MLSWDKLRRCKLHLRLRSHSGEDNPALQAQMSCARVVKSFLMHRRTRRTLWILVLWPYENVPFGTVAPASWPAVARASQPALAPLIAPFHAVRDLAAVLLLLPLAIFLRSKAPPEAARLLRPLQFRQHSSSIPPLSVQTSKSTTPLLATHRLTCPYLSEVIRSPSRKKGSRIGQRPSTSLEGLFT
jgi:hypothetical protein